MMVWPLQVPPIFTDPVGTVIDAVSGEVTGAVTGAVGDVVGKVFEGLVAFLSSGVKMLLDGMTDLLGAVTDADVTEAWYRDGPYRLLASVSLSVTALLFISQVPVAALRGETGQLVRKALVTMPLAVLCIMWAPALTGRLSTLADGLTTLFGGAASEQLSDGFARLATASSVTGAAAPSLMSLVGLLLLFLSSLILWLVLMLRAAALALIVGMVPLGAAAMLHDRIKEMMPTVTKLVVVTVLAKPVIFWAMSVGAAYLAAALPGGVDTAAAPQPGSDPGLIVGGLANVSTLIVGALVMLCAAISPMALFKVIPGFDGAFSGGALGSGATSAVGAAAGVGLAGAKLAQLRGGSKGVGASDADSGGDDSVVGDVDSGQAAQLGAAAATGGTSEAAMLGSEGGSTGGGPTGDGPAGGGGEPAGSGPGSGSGDGESSGDGGVGPGDGGGVVDAAGDVAGIVGEQATGSSGGSDAGGSSGESAGGSGGSLVGDAGGGPVDALGDVAAVVGGQATGDGGGDSSGSADPVLGSSSDLGSTL